MAGCTVSVADYPDFATPQAHATAIAATGVPLLAAPATLINRSGVTILGGNTNVLAPVTFTQVGYATQIMASFPAAATNPFISVELLWADAATSLVYDDAHYITVGASGATAFTTLGNGPARSGQLTMSITNLDPAQTVTLQIQVAQDSSIRTTDRWYWRTNVDIGLPVPTFTPATLVPDEDVLGILHGVTVPASTSVTYLFGMAPGRTVNFAGTLVTTPPASVTYQVSPAPLTTYTSAADVLITAPAAANFGYQFIAPRAPLYLKITNSSATAGTIFCMMNAAE